jgi:hypothetical protein
MKKLFFLFLAIMTFINLAQAQVKDLDPFMVSHLLATREGKPVSSGKDLVSVNSPIMDDTLYIIYSDFVKGVFSFAEYNRITNQKILWSVVVPGEYYKIIQEGNKTTHVKISKEVAFENGWRILKFFPKAKELLHELGVTKSP